jgi:hypothetical protein
MIRIIADQYGVSIVTDTGTYDLVYDDVESFESLVNLFEDLGFEAEYEVSL